MGGLIQQKRILEMLKKHSKKPKQFLKKLLEQNWFKKLKNKKENNSNNSKERKNQLLQKKNKQKWKLKKPKRKWKKKRKPRKEKLLSILELVKLEKDTVPCLVENILVWLIWKLMLLEW